MPRLYRGSINIDYTGGNGPWQQQLIRALVQSGWTYVETSALTIQTEDLAKVWRGADLVARASEKIGGLSAFTFHIQGSNDFESGVSYSGVETNKGALQGILDLPFPVPGP